MPKLSRQLLISFALLAVLIVGRCAVAAEAFAEATQLYRTNQWQQAATAFDLLAKNPKNNEATRQTALLYAGESLMQLGKHAEARQRYLLVEQNAPTASLAAQALFRLGEVAWLSGETTEASKLLQAYLEKYPVGASASYAENYLAQIRHRQSSHANFAVLDEAVGWERDGRHDAAQAAYRKLLKEHVGRDQVRAETLRRAAKLHDRLSQSREALGLYQQFLAEYPDAEQTPEVLNATAWLHVQLDQPTQAAEQFRGVVSNFPKSAQAVEAAYWLGLASADKKGSEKDADQAAQYVDWLLEHETLPTERPQLWGKTLCLKCQLVSGRGEWKQVEQVVASAKGRLDDGPLSTKLEFWAAEAAFRQKQYDTARERYKALQPKIIGINKAWTGMVPLRRAQLAARRQQWSKVLKILDQFEQEHPEFELDYEIDYLRGRALAGRGEMTAARKFYRQVLDNRAAKETEAATMAGWMTGETFFHQHDYVRARAAYQAVMEKTTLPEWQTRAALQAGKCWELEQQWDEAADVYATALKHWPDTDQQLETRLRWAQGQQKSQQK